MRKLLVVVLLASTWSTVLSADDIDPLIGDWVSPDGYARQSFEWSFENDLVQTKMWFRGESGWQQVAEGFAYRRPGQVEWQMISRTKDMDDLALFESRLERITETTYRVINVAYKTDGSTIETEEDWLLDGPDSFQYTVFRVEDGNRIEWLSGEWVRNKESD